MNESNKLDYMVQQWVIYQKQLVEDLERLHTMATLILTVQAVVLIVVALQVYWDWPLW